MSLRVRARRKPILFRAPSGKCSVVLMNIPAVEMSGVRGAMARELPSYCTVRSRNCGKRSAERVGANFLAPETAEAGTRGFFDFCFAGDLRGECDLRFVRIAIVLISRLDSLP